MIIVVQSTEGLCDAGGRRGMRGVTRRCLWRLRRMITVSLRLMVARLEADRRSRAGREGEEEPVRRRSQGGITHGMLTTEQRLGTAESRILSLQRAACSQCAVHGRNLLSILQMSHDNFISEILYQS